MKHKHWKHALALVLALCIVLGTGILNSGNWLHASEGQSETQPATEPATEPATNPTQAPAQGNSVTEQIVLPAETVAETVPGETVAETVPGETVAETVPGETVAETVPGETVAETVPEEVLPAATIPLTVIQQDPQEKPLAEKPWTTQVSFAEGEAKASVTLPDIEGYITPELTVERTAETTALEVKATYQPKTAEAAAEEAEEVTSGSITYQRNEDGSLVLDANGNPIPVLAEGAQAPAEYVRDETGALVLDANGNPIPVNVVPEGAPKLSTIVDEVSPNRSIDIYAKFEGEYLNIGDHVTLISVLSGYDAFAYNLQWQMKQGDSWVDIPGATGSAYGFTLDADNYYYEWRLVVNITGTLDG